MSNILSQAKLFFEACETGKGWDGCEAYVLSFWGHVFSPNRGVV